MTKRLIGAAGLAVAVGGAGVFVLTRPPADATMAQRVVGRWRAVDPTNAALHNRTGDVVLEEAVFESDGKLTYLVTMANAEPPKPEPWGWEVEKGKLALSDRGPGSTGERLAAFKFSVDDQVLSIRRRGFPAKEFERVGG